MSIAEGFYCTVDGFLPIWPRENMQSFNKDPGESYPIAVDFKEKLPPNGALSSASIVAIDTADGSDASEVVASTTAAISGTLASFTIQGGKIKHIYKITLWAMLNVGGPLRENILMSVDED